ncbi:MAG: glycosyltransferase family 1 protein [Candidatus Pelagibacter sp. TMED118]|nr:MAG: glycosyltransferase family 1 protein [Candidatus Pelagibacter sp. TMED118]|tara:strand:- start:4659 stop:5759 length:1101 start_codon:yes stop_codon:yes gene_type:complete
MNNVIFDYKVFFEQPLGGASKYIFELNKELNNLKIQSKIISPFHINKYLNNNNLSVSYFKFDDHYPRFTRKFLENFNKNYIKRYLRKNSIDLIHFTLSNENYLKKFTGKKVVTVYDLIHEKFSNFYDLPENYISKKQELLQEMDHIICISENTKKDLLNYYNMDDKKVSVTHLAVSNYNLNTSKDIYFKINKPFILFVGHRKRYKNFINFINAYSKSKKIKKNYNIICFGNDRFDNAEKNIIKSLKIEEKIYFETGDDSKLKQFYEKSSLFVFPSLYEGFGLPLLEAMKYGCPVCCSSTSSLLEIGSDAVEYFDPNNIDSIIASMEKVLFSEDYRKSLIKKGYNNIINFTWERCAINTLNIYKKII